MTRQENPLLLTVTENSADAIPCEDLNDAAYRFTDSLTAAATPSAARAQTSQPLPRVVELKASDEVALVVSASRGKMSRTADATAEEREAFHLCVRVPGEAQAGDFHL
jgi:hypothetical protein